MESKPLVRLVTKASKHCDIVAYCAEGDLFAFAWSEDMELELLVTIRNMARTPDHVGRDAHLDLSTLVSFLSLNMWCNQLTDLDYLGQPRSDCYGDHSIQETSDFDYIPVDDIRHSKF
jgi:hypothetical protein